MPILKAVIDTNVMISMAFAKEGVAKKLKDLIADNAFTMVTSKAILKELYEVLHYPHILKRFKPKKSDIDEFIGVIIENALITKGIYSAQGITEDPRDDIFAYSAQSGQSIRRIPDTHSAPFRTPVPVNPDTSSERSDAGFF